VTFSSHFAAATELLDSGVDDVDDVLPANYGVDVTVRLGRFNTERAGTRLGDLALVVPNDIRGPVSRTISLDVGNDLATVVDAR